MLGHAMLLCCWGQAGVGVASVAAVLRNEIGWAKGLNAAPAMLVGATVLQRFAAGQVWHCAYMCSTAHT